LGNRISGIFAPGSGEQDRPYCHVCGTTEDFTGSNNPVGVFSFCSFLFKGESYTGLFMGGYLFVGRCPERLSETLNALNLYFFPPN